MTDNALVKIDEVVRQHQVAALDQMASATTKAVALSRAMKQLKQLISGETLSDFMELAGSHLGFRTDRDNQNGKGYPPEVIRDALIEGMLRGAQPIGNEINIISGRCYLTKEFFERQLRQLVEQLRVVEGVPRVSDSGALVPMRATWRYNGRPDSIDCTEDGDDGDTRICVKVNQGMGVDAILGKAYRKLYARIFRRVTGSHWVNPDDEPPAEVIQAIATDSTTSQLTDDEWRSELMQELVNYELCSDVSAYESEMVSRADTPAQRQVLIELCEKRRDEIRNSRGERSNKPR